MSSQMELSPVAGTSGNPARWLLWVVLAVVWVAIFAVLVPLAAKVTLGLVAGAALLGLCIRRPALAAYGMIATLPFFSFLLLPITRNGLRLSVAFTLLAVGVWMLRLLVARERDRLTRLLSDPRARWILALILVVLSSTAVNLRAGKGVVLTVGEGTAASAVMWAALFRLLFLVVAYFGVLGLLQTRPQVHAAVKALFVTGCVIGALGIVELRAGRSIYLVVYGARPPGQADFHPETAARLASVEGDAPFHSYNCASYAALALYFLTRARTWRGRALLGLVLLMLAINVVGTASRGGILALLAVLGTFTLLQGGRYRFPILVVLPALFLIVGLTLSLVLPNYDIQRVATDERGINFRLANIPMALGMFADHPILGVGPDGFRVRYYSYETPDASRERTSDVHNAYLETLTSYGVLGLVVFIGLLGVHAWVVLRAWGAATDPDLKCLLAALLSMFLAFVVFAATSEGLNQPLLWVQFGLAGALASSLRAGAGCTRRGAPA